ncbi:hypothetical protein Anapl_01107 [Anas platyrhynchos]|uniref:Uncharacterized protein n=1 Tax=Anas platyrhynchos TaxID=8839 RepID=R0L2F7_ANAPL|nr:hypothetical protein Anapl_01107 [Anas platyrhynchos]
MGHGCLGKSEESNHLLLSVKKPCDLLTVFSENLLELQFGFQSSHWKDFYVLWELDFTDQRQTPLAAPPLREQRCGTWSGTRPFTLLTVGSLPMQGSPVPLSLAHSSSVLSSGMHDLLHPYFNEPQQREANMAQAPADPGSAEPADPEESSPNMIVYRKLPLRGVVLRGIAAVVSSSALQRQRSCAMGDKEQGWLGPVRSSGKEKPKYAGPNGLNGTEMSYQAEQEKQRGDVAVCWNDLSVLSCGNDQFRMDVNTELPPVHLLPPQKPGFVLKELFTNPFPLVLSNLDKNHTQILNYHPILLQQNLRKALGKEKDFTAHSKQLATAESSEVTVVASTQSTESFICSVFGNPVTLESVHTKTFFHLRTSSEPSLLMLESDPRNVFTSMECSVYKT